MGGGGSCTLSRTSRCVRVGGGRVCRDACVRVWGEGGGCVGMPV